MAYGKTVTKSTVPASTSEVTILAANAARKGATIRNTDANILYIDFITGVSSTDHTQAIATGGYYEVPYAWKGVVVGRWAAVGSGAALVREIA